ncbi:hypothetical protein [Ahniella affigens]|uniref:hypothetical protein n=1 Tax=Ahniella affigens TaxID=2021234 RepID=UPI0011B28222|nr:hypothetical protein [Ahniella affigens]
MSDNVTAPNSALIYTYTMTTSPQSIRTLVLWTLWPLVVLCVLVMLMAGFMWFFSTLLFTPELIADMRLDPAFERWPAELWELILEMPTLMLVTFVAALVTLVICIGGLLRTRWGYWGLVASFWLGVPLNLLGIIWHWRFMDRVFPALSALLADYGVPGGESGYWSAQLSGVMFGLVFAVGFGLTARQLQRPEVNAYFNRATNPKAPS